ncbi:hypothetical protein PHYSODRAFT_505222, partial [Phytophthora sojae]
FEKWASAVAALYKKNPEGAEMAIASTLTAKLSDEALSSAVKEATERVAPLARKVEEVQLDKWMRKALSADDAFKLLKPNSADENILNNPWVSYVTKLDETNADEQMFVILKRSYSEQDLALILARSKGFLRGDVAKRMEGVQLQLWLKEGKTLDDIFTLLKLDKQGDKLFEVPAVVAWSSYANLLDGSPGKSMLSTLTAYFDDYTIAKMLAAARVDDEVKIITTKLEDPHLSRWKSDGKSADDIFTLFKLGDEVDDVLANPLLPTCMAYADKLKENPFSLLLAKLKRSPDTDDKLAKKSLTATDGRSTGNLKDVNAKLERIMLDKWVHEGKTADDAFDFLLKRYHRFIFEVPAVNTWVSYVTKLEKENPYQTMIAVLRGRFGDKKLDDMLVAAIDKIHAKAVAERLRGELWLSQERTADDVFELLYLNDWRRNLFDRPHFSTWVSYVVRLDKENADDVMFSIVKSHNNDKDLAMMLTTSKNDQVVKIIAAKLKGQ